MLAAYQTKESKRAFGQLLNAIAEIGKSFPKYAERTKLTDDEIKQLPEPERTPNLYAGTVNPNLTGNQIEGKWYPSRTYFQNGKPVLPPTIDGKPTKCIMENWDFSLQGAVAPIPSRSRKGVIKIFGRFVKEILTEEKRQNNAGLNDLITAEKRAKTIRKIAPQNATKIITSL
jgi:hypothetical protein